MSDSLSRQFPMPPELSLDGVSPASAAAGQLSPAAASTPRCQDSWQRLADPEGRVFWHNNRTVRCPPPLPGHKCVLVTLVCPCIQQNFLRSAGSGSIDVAPVSLR